MGTTHPHKKKQKKMKTTRKRKKAISKGIVRICSQCIEWCLEGKGLFLSEREKEYISNMLIDNYVEGDLCAITPNGQTVFGQWNIQWN